MIALQREEDWVMPVRVPYEERALFPPQELRRPAAMPAGVRIVFMSDTDVVAGTIMPDLEAATKHAPSDDSVASRSHPSQCGAICVQSV